MSKNDLAKLQREMHCGGAYCFVAGPNRPDTCECECVPCIEAHGAFEDWYFATVHTGYHCGIYAACTDRCECACAVCGPTRAMEEGHALLADREREFDRRYYGL